jgi:hypothetical protein
VFSDKFNSVRAELTAPSSGPTVASVQSSDVPALRETEPSFVLGGVTMVSRKAGEAVRIGYSMSSPRDVTTGKSVVLAVERYEFWKAGRLVTLTLASPKGSDNVDPWRIVTDSFAWLT